MSTHFYFDFLEITLCVLHHKRPHKSLESEISKPFFLCWEHSRKFLLWLGVDNVIFPKVQLMSWEDEAILVWQMCPSHLEWIFSWGRKQKGFHRNDKGKRVTLTKLQKLNLWFVSSLGYFRCWDCHIADGCFCLPWWVENCFQGLFPYKCSFNVVFAVSYLWITHCPWPQWKLGTSSGTIIWESVREVTLRVWWETGTIVSWVVTHSSNGKPSEARMKLAINVEKGTLITLQIPASTWDRSMHFRPLHRERIARVTI